MNLRYACIKPVVISSFRPKRTRESMQPSYKKAVISIFSS